MTKVEFPIFMPRKRNLLFSSCLVLLIMFSILFLFGWAVSNYFITAIVGIIIYGSLLISLFYVLDKYHANHKEIGKMIIEKKRIAVQIEKESFEFNFEDIKELKCYYYYSNNKFAFFHQLQKIVDIEIQTKKSSIDIICPVKVDKINLIDLLETLPLNLSLIHKRRR